jgi:hypothetical protein
MGRVLRILAMCPTRLTEAAPSPCLSCLLTPLPGCSGRLPARPTASHILFDLRPLGGAEALLTLCFGSTTSLQAMSSPKKKAGAKAKPAKATKGKGEGETWFGESPLGAYTGCHQKMVFLLGGPSSSASWHGGELRTRVPPLKPVPALTIRTQAAWTSPGAGGGEPAPAARRPSLMETPSPDFEAGLLFERFGAGQAGRLDAQAFQKMWREREKLAQLRRTLPQPPSKSFQAHLSHLEAPM